MEKKFKFVVIDNETSEVKEEIDTDCIIAGVSREDEFQAIGITHCNAETMAKTIVTAENVIKKLKKENPVVAVLCEFVRTEEVDSDGENDE